MSYDIPFADQPQRNEMGFDVTCQILALLDTLINERQRHDDFQTFGNLLDAIVPRLQDLGNAAMALFTDQAALGGDNLHVTVYGRCKKDGLS